MKTLQEFIDFYELETSCKCNPNLDKDLELLKLLKELQERRKNDKD